MLPKCQKKIKGDFSTYVRKIMSYLMLRAVNIALHRYIVSVYLLYEYLT